MNNTFYKTFVFIIFALVFLSLIGAVSGCTPLLYNLSGGK